MNIDENKIFESMRYREALQRTNSIAEQAMDIVMTQWAQKDEKTGKRSKTMYSCSKEIHNIINAIAKIQNVTDKILNPPLPKRKIKPCGKFGRKK